MKQFLTRSLTGFFFAAITIFLILFNKYTFLLFLLISNTWLTIEFQKIQKLEKNNGNLILNIIIENIIIFMVFLQYLCYNNNVDFSFVFIFLTIPFIFELYGKNEINIKKIAISCISYIYITLPLILCLFIVNANYFKYGDKIFVPIILIAIFVLIWCNDVFAYLTGCFIFRKKRHLLFERISPKKSWEGSIGGAIVTLFAGFIANKIDILNFLNKYDWLVIAIIVVVAGTWGDLIESMFKRRAGVKDSGKLLAGHGGLLDRLDSFIFTIPFIFFYLTLKKNFL